jgi:hypothetical protein
MSEKNPILYGGIPERSLREAWGWQEDKLQTGIALFAITGDCTIVSYSLLDGVKSDFGANLALYFPHMTVRIRGKALAPLVDGIRQQIVSYIQEQHVSEFQEKEVSHWIESIKIGKPATEELVSGPGFRFQN